MRSGTRISLYFWLTAGLRTLAEYCLDCAGCDLKDAGIAEHRSRQAESASRDDRGGAGLVRGLLPFCRIYAVIPL